MSPPQSFEEDLAFSKTLHNHESEHGGLLAKITSKDKEAFENVVNNYMKYWTDKDPMTESEETKEARRSNYTNMTNAYYNIATDFYEYGWGESFHFCRFYPGENFYQAIARHEHYLAMQLNIKSGMKVLDVGCGVGGPAREICQLSGAHITGINNNDYQISRAIRSAARIGIDNKTNFIKGNFMEMPFEDDSFDAVYAIEATCHAPKLEGVYGEVFRVLKPGGTFAFYEWCVTDKYDPNDPEHRRIIRGVEYADGIPELFKTSVALQSLKNVGFEVVSAEDLALNDDTIPWYYPLEGDIRKAQCLWDYFSVFRMTHFGKFCTRALVGGLEKVGIAPAGSFQTQIVLETAGDCLVEGGKLGIFTPMYLMVGRKPQN
ncbi:S-adenosyl-L-methionine-dependent methyltransferase [Rhizophagus diaphanus]|nr:S-adenosyl-L-methionine-dependent methyltransferase [Rhizophagus diaphanus] [Rhizophagus sp. MUCL 43196]